MTLFTYQDVLAVMRDATTFANGFIAEGLGGFFDGLIILAMDGVRVVARGVLQPVLIPETVNRWRTELDRVIREDFLVPKMQADLMDFGLYFRIREMYALMDFPTDDTDVIIGTGRAIETIESYRFDTGRLDVRYFIRQ